MTTEFDKFWVYYAATPEGVACGRAFAEKVWNAGQRRLPDTLERPPYMPVVGDRVRLLSLAHPRRLGAVVTVTQVEAENLKVYTFEARTDDGTLSAGFLGEVEKVS